MIYGARQLKNRRGHGGRRGGGARVLVGGVSAKRRVPFTTFVKFTDCNKNESVPYLFKDIDMNNNEIY